MEFIYQTNRIYSEDENKKVLAEIILPDRDKNRMDIKHVYVDEALRHHGLASHMMVLAYDYIKNQGKQIVAKCPYAIDWFKKHPEYQDIVINVKTKKME